MNPISKAEVGCMLGWRATASTARVNCHRCIALGTDLTGHPQTPQSEDVQVIRLWCPSNEGDEKKQSSPYKQYQSLLLILSKDEKLQFFLHPQVKSMIQMRQAKRLLHYCKTDYKHYIPVKILLLRAWENTEIWRLYGNALCYHIKGSECNDLRTHPQGTSCSTYKSGLLTVSGAKNRPACIPST